MARVAPRRAPLRLLCLAALFCLLLLAAPSMARAEDSNDAAEAATPATDAAAAPDSLPDVPPAAESAESDAAAEPADPPKPKPKPKNAEPISLTRPDFCRACHSVVEEFHKWTVRNFIDPSARKNTTMSRSELVEWFCRSPPFDRWKESIMWGCIKTVQDHHDDVLEPFLGTRSSGEFTTLAKVYDHKIAACTKIDACDPPSAETQSRSKSDCDSCDRLVRDITWVLWREQKVNETVVRHVLSTVCMEVGMRHRRPMEIEAFCHEHVDEHWNDVIKMIVKVYNDPDIPMWDRNNQMKKRFCGMMTEVCEEERKQMAAEIKKKKEEERAARLAAREAKKKRGASAAADTKPADSQPAAAEPAKPKEEL